MLNTYVEVICYKSKRLSNGEFPLMLRITKAGKRKYVSLGVSIDERFWDFKKCRLKNNCPQKEVLEKLIESKRHEYLDTALEMMAGKQEFTASSLARKVDRKHFSMTVEDMYQKIILDLQHTKSLGNKEVYVYSHNSLLEFSRRSLDIPFIDIDSEWLCKYELWLRNKHLKDTTISILFRTLRSVYNKAIEAGAVKQEHYPFTSFRMSRLDTKTKKRAISKEAILRIAAMDLSQHDHYTTLAKDMFMFSYFGAGINFSDMALLKHSNIKDGRVHYIRKKTGKPISFPLLNEAMQIIAKYYNPKKNSDDYIFPILNRKAHLSEQQKRDRIRKVLKAVNNRLKIIGKMAGIEHLTTYVARHSYATVLKRAGVSVEIISETLGHSSLNTTQIYLDSFENSQIDKALENLK